MNTNWKIQANHHYNHFISNSHIVSELQNDILFNIIDKNKNCKFGKEHNFTKIKDINTYRDKIPVRSYEDLKKYMLQIEQGEKQILTTENVLLFEPTSGSESGSKLIPYTNSLKSEFRNAIDVWLWDILTKHPNIATKKSYWSVSPALTKVQTTEGGLKIGFDSDLEYLGWNEQDAARIFFIPAEISNIKSYENFKFLTAFFMLATGNLSFVSVWSPTFLSQIIETIKKYPDLLIRALSESITYLPVDENISFLEPYIKKNKSRSIELTKIFCSDFNYNQIWPELELISCWADAGAEPYANELKRLFPKSKIQPKGLLSTEGFTTIPLFDANGSVPAYTSHFLEFNDDANNSFLIHELEKNKEYTVLLTTSGGLYRYNTNDKVVVTGFWASLPLLKFVGRAHTCDLTGEKLNEVFVNSCIKKIKTDTDFIMLSPDSENVEPHYILFIEPKNTTIDLKNIAEEMEQLLCKNFHYKYSRQTGQLKGIEIILVENGMNKYFHHLKKTGIKAGDIKPVLFHKNRNWKNVLINGFFFDNN